MSSSPPKNAATPAAVSHDAAVAAGGAGAGAAPQNPSASTPAVNNHASSYAQVSATAAASSNNRNTSMRAPSSSTTSTAVSGGVTRPNDASRHQQSGNQRRNHQPRDWAQNLNTASTASQRSTATNSPQNGIASTPPFGSSNNNNKSSTMTETPTSDMHANDRMTFLMFCCVGLQATVTTKSGERYTGIFSAASAEAGTSSFILKMSRKLAKNETSTSFNEVGSPYVGNAPDYALSFKAVDVSDVIVPNVPQPPTSSKPSRAPAPSFKTDTDISNNAPIHEKPLQRWNPGNDGGADLSLEASTGTTTGWNQFEANERLFGATTNYDENLYTTRINRDDPTYKQKAATAAKIAREINAESVSNAHMREERGLSPENDFDDEAKYSGVRRDADPNKPLHPRAPNTTSNKYIPPARRLHSAAATTTAAPVEPAATQATPPSVSKAPVKPDVSTPSIPPETTTKEPETSTESNKGTAAVASAVKLPSNVPTKSPTVNAPPQKDQATPQQQNAMPTEPEVLSSFRQFASKEKAKVQELCRNPERYATQQKAIANQQKAIASQKVGEQERPKARMSKYEEFLQFSKNFKLGTPVPTDLVPILAKDPSKQEAIVEKARRQYEEKINGSKGITPPAVNASKPDAPTQDPSPKTTAAVTTTTSTVTTSVPTPPTAANIKGQQPRPQQQQLPPQFPQQPVHQQQPRPNNGIPPVPQGDNRMTYRNRQNFYGNQQMNNRPMQFNQNRPGHFSARLTNIQNDIQAGRRVSGGPFPQPIPAPMAPAPHVPDARANRNKTFGPSKFNGRAGFNQNGNGFAPPPHNPVASTPPVASNKMPRPGAQPSSPSAFWASKKPVPPSERPSFKENFNSLKRVKHDTENSPTKDMAAKGGIPPPYRTLPTWDCPPVNQDKTYKDLFKGLTSPPTTQPGRSPMVPPMPYHPQMPFPMQPNGTAPNGITPVPPQFHPPSHPPAGPMMYDDPTRMSMSSSQSHLYPSPRFQQNPVFQPPPMMPPAQFAYQQPIPGYYGQPPMQMRYPNMPQFPNSHHPMGAPVMMPQHQPANTHLMPQGMPMPYNQQMGVFAPNPAMYPQQQMGQPAQAGFPSPNRSVPMMMHGSQQGHHPVYR